MRIFTAIKHSLDPQYFYGGLWNGNFYPALRELGHEIIESQVDLLPASRFMHIAKDFTREEQEVRAQITQQVVEEVKKAHRDKPVDLFLSYFYNAHLDPSSFDEIHRIGIPTVNFYRNSIYQFEFVEAIARKVNFTWHTEKEAKPFYLKAGAHPVWVQMGANREMYYPLSKALRQPKACFVGRRYADRDRYLASLITNKVPLDIFGPGWGDTDRAVTNGKDTFLGRKMIKPGSVESCLETVLLNIQGQGIFVGTQRTIYQWQYRQKTRRLAKVLSSAVRGPGIDYRQVYRTFNQYEVVLNFSNVWADGRPGSKLIPHVRLRDFEAPMCRTCYLTGHSEEIAEFYEIGKEIDTYRIPEELVDKTRFYLTHPEQAEKMREAGYQRARRDHTWVSRFRELFSLIGLG